MSNETIKLLLVDDHHMFMDGIYAILKDISHIDIVGTANNGNQALKIAKSSALDLLITDIEMPEMDGIQLSKSIKKTLPNIKVIVVSSHSNVQTIDKLRKLQIDGYLLKNTGKIELLNAINKVYKGEKYFSEEILRVYNQSLFGTNKAEKEKVKLSPRELEVLKCIVQEQNTQEIAESLNISVNTVDTHRKNLMRKIGAKNVVGLTKYAIQQGIIA
ncbi:response regulator [Aquimarina brevivitae]|uniref:LuxR family two component transcriptional regulator n=1 Tax=Aquimarina brevivitae TaxID=323412 RepID=A0A4Q7NU82_9FLAO|nr:response regulator transcription factor [Aquimarina brevivitae]RZS90500.1 LuxR family two component transcriptional regulator [Aquimarina brevivitae]